jgi:uncharacterized protein involved in exopolysaccharide biosynthesis
VYNEQFGLIDLLIVLAKHKLPITAMTGGCAVLALITSLLLPNIYTGTAKIMPPQQNQSAAAALLGQLGGLASIAGSTINIKNPNDLYVGMLNSRTIGDSIISRFHLHKLYDKETMVETRQELAERTNVTAGKDGLITLEFDDEDPERAAAVANAYIEELDKLTQSLAITEAGQRRHFFERQLHQAKEELTKAEIALKTTQEKTGLIKLYDQGKAIIEAVTTLRAQIAAKEVELRAMRTFATEQNSEVIRAQQQLAGLRAELVKLERAQAVGPGDILVPTGKVPEAGLEYLRKFRDVRYQETIFELLAKQFEAAKIDEAKEAALIQVIDKAVAPDRKAKPKRLLIVLVGLVLGALLSVCWAFTREYLHWARQDSALGNKVAELRLYMLERKWVAGDTGR